MEWDDLRFLRRAIAIAQQARDHGNHPFGALLVDGQGSVLLEAENTVVSERDVTGHALLAIDGHNVDFAEIEKIQERHSMAFWKPALSAAAARQS